MKKILGIALVALVAGCATAPVVEKPADVEKAASAEPELPQLTDPNPFANYGAGMASDKARPMAYEWQSAHDAEIAAATRPEVLLKFLESDEAAVKLLDEVKPDYKTDPIVLIQIGAISQLVMCTKLPDAPKFRALWTKALLGRVAASQTKDTYCALFYLDQLRWCGQPDEAKELRKLAGSWNRIRYKVTQSGNTVTAEPQPQTEQEKTDTRHVREFIAQVEREIAK